MNITAEFILEIAGYALIAFGIFCVTAAAICWIMFKGRKLTGESLSTIIAQTEVPKLTTIIMIIVAVTFLGLVNVVEGESVITILSGVAGYVLGSRHSSVKEAKKTSGPASKSTGDSSSSATEPATP